MDERETYDVVVYGATSGGVAAAVEVARAGRRALLIATGEILGGLSSGGLGATDIGNKAAIGGLGLEFYRRVADHYRSPESWRFQEAEDFRSGRRADRDTAAMWVFEPHVAAAIFEDLVREAGVTVLRSERLDRADGVVRSGGRIVELVLESGRRCRGAVFVDATYEGDLFAAAGVSYHVGREANDVYGETLNGVQTAHAVKHQIDLAVDPWVVPGDPSSGLLPLIESEAPGPDGSGDAGVQAYCFRMCLTDAPENRLPIEKPEGYDPARFELLFRYFDAGFDRVPWHNLGMPNRKTDINNNHGISTDHIGAGHRWPEAGYAERERIFRDHLAYQLGLLWALTHEERVPEAVRDEVGRWGLPRDEYASTGHWTHELYVREARRLVGAYVMTQHDCQGGRVAPCPVGLAAYTMDSHNVHRYVRDGRAVNEGDVQVGGFPPYGIAYGAITPRASECENLLVPVCLSASHIAFGSIRMEPVFMVLGQSAAVAATLAIERGTTVQDVDYGELRRRLLERGQVLEWREPRD